MSNKKTNTGNQTPKPLYTLNVEDVVIHLSLGNSKVGHVINFSTLPGDKDHMLVAKGKLLTSEPGTCSGKCEGCFHSCYARRSVLQHHNSVTLPWLNNTLLVRYHLEQAFEEIDARISQINHSYVKSGKLKDVKYTLFRYGVSGELTCLEELEKLNALAEEHPEISFGIYSKAGDILIAFFQKHKQTADNFTINVSQWHGTMDDTIRVLRKLKAKFNIFEYDDSNRVKNNLSDEEKERLSKLPHCPAVGATSKNKHPINPKTKKPWKCSDCRACYTKTCTHRGVWSH